MGAQHNCFGRDELTFEQTRDGKSVYCHSGA